MAKMITWDSKSLGSPASLGGNPHLNELRVRVPAGQALMTDIPSLPVSVPTKYYLLLAYCGATDKTVRRHVNCRIREALAKIPDPDTRAMRAIRIAENYCRGNATEEDLLEARGLAKSAWYGLEIGWDPDEGVSAEVCKSWILAYKAIAWSCVVDLRPVALRVVAAAIMASRAGGPSDPAQENQTLLNDLLDRILKQP